MEKNATIAAMKAAQKEREKEAFAQNKGYKFADWFKTKAIPAAFNAADEFFKAVGRIRFNWVGILILVILVYLANNGFLEDMPNIKWLVESAVRLAEWCLDLFRIFIGWFIGFLDSKFVDVFDIFGIFEWMANFLRTIFAL